MVERFEIIKDTDTTYHGVVFDSNGALIWESKQAMLADDLSKFLHDQYGFHQLDIFEKLSSANPDKFFVDMDKELSLAKEILTKNLQTGSYNPLLIKQLESWVNRKKSELDKRRK